MAVTRKKDVGALIAESIDNYYAKQKSAAYWYEWRQRAGKLFESVKILSESECRTLRLFESAADVDLSKDPTYRKGYKSGWKRGRDNPSDNQPPAEHADDSTYTAGFEAGLQASQHGQKLLHHAKSKEEDGPDSPFANDEEAGDHFLQNVVFPHFPHVENEKKGYLSQRGQLDKISDKEGEQGRPRAGGRAGDDWDEHGHGWFVGSGMEAPQSFHDMPGFVERMNAAVDTDDESGYNVGKPGKEGASPFHPADFGRVLGVKMTGNANRGAGIQVGQYHRDVEGGVGQQQQRDDDQPPPDDGPSGDDSGPKPPAEKPQVDPELMQKLHGHYVDNLHMLRSALGDDAVDAHLAHSRGEEGGQHHAGIADFMSKNYGPEHYDEYIQHAHDVWKGHILDKAREAQAAGDPRLQKTKVPLYDPNDREPEFTFTHPTTGKETVGGGHFRPVLDEQGNHVEREIDPLEYLENSLNDPYGHKGDAPEYEEDPETGEKVHLGRGWNQRHAKKLGFSDLSKARRVKNPGDTGRGPGVFPSVARVQRSLDRANEWLHNTSEGHHENEMWDFHYGLAPKGDYTRKRGGAHARKTRAQERGVGQSLPSIVQQGIAGDIPAEKVKAAVQMAKRTQDRPKHFGKERLSKGASDVAARLKRSREGHAEKLRGLLGDQADFAFFMLGLLDEWLEENLGYSEDQRTPIMESLFNRVESNYGNLFEVAY